MAGSSSSPNYARNHPSMLEMSPSPSPGHEWYSRSSLFKSGLRIQRLHLRSGNFDACCAAIFRSRNAAFEIRRSATLISKMFLKRARGVWDRCDLIHIPRSNLRVDGRLAVVAALDPPDILASKCAICPSVKSDAQDGLSCSQNPSIFADRT